MPQCAEGMRYEIFLTLDLTRLYQRLRDIHVDVILSRLTLQYRLETFCEGRTSAWTEVPYPGGPIDGPMNGPPPLPWNILFAPPEQFKDQVALMPVPHTDEIRVSRCCSTHSDTFLACMVII